MNTERYNEFWLDKDQHDKLIVWQSKIFDLFGEYGAYTYSFGPSNGIGIEVVVYSHLTKTTLDLTDVDKW